MRSIFMILLFALFTSQVLSAVLVKTGDKDVQGGVSVDKDVQGDVPVNKDGLHILCKPCEKFFEEVKKYLPEASTLTKDALKMVIDTECKTVDFIPFVDKICEKIGDWAIDEIFDLIVNEDGKIDPHHDCQVIKLC